MVNMFESNMVRSACCAVVLCLCGSVIDVRGMMDENINGIGTCLRDDYNFSPLTLTFPCRVLHISNLSPKEWCESFNMIKKSVSVLESSVDSKVLGIMAPAIQAFCTMPSVDTMPFQSFVRFCSSDSFLIVKKTVVAFLSLFGRAIEELPRDPLTSSISVKLKNLLHNNGECTLPLVSVSDTQLFLDIYHAIRLSFQE